MTMDTLGFEPRALRRADVIPLHHVPLRSRGTQRIYSFSCAAAAGLPVLRLFVQKSARRARRQNAETRDRTGDLQIFGLTLPQLSYRGIRVTLPLSASYRKLSERSRVQVPEQPRLGAATTNGASDR